MKKSDLHTWTLSPGFLPDFQILAGIFLTHIRDAVESLNE